MPLATAQTALAAAPGHTESLPFATLAAIAIGLPLVAVIYLELAEGARKKRAEREARMGNAYRDRS